MNSISWLAVIALSFTSTTAHSAKWDSTSPTDVAFAKIIAKEGDRYNCNPRGWFSGYNTDTTFAFLGPVIAIFNVKYSDNTYTRGTIEPVHHLLSITKRKKYSMLGEVFFVDNKSTSGSMTMEFHELGNITLSVTLQGRSMTTDFSCEFDIKNQFRN